MIKKYENLITVDIICHGVPSQKLFFDELSELNINSSDVKTVSFRNEKGYLLSIDSFDNKILYADDSINNNYYRNFLNGNFFRENCYNCRYACKERVSDITIGDFWGLSDDCKIKDDEFKGISVALANTEVGLTLINSVKDKCFIEERSIQEACKTNEQLNHPMKKNDAYSIYVKNYPKYGYKKTMKLMLPLKSKIKIFIRKNKIFYNLYKIVKK